jgi:uncharacterized protein YjbI with pentapeptide repeats
MSMAHAGFVRILCCGFLLAVGSAPAQAAECSATPSPGVNWKRCSLVDQSFPGADLTGANLSDGRFLRTDFSAAKLVGVNATGAKFVSAVLAKADLGHANLQDADLTGADLSQANLSGVDFSRAVLFNAVLRNAVLTGAKLDSADLTNADFSGALWVDGKRRCGAGSLGTCGNGPVETPGGS